MQPAAATNPADDEALEAKVRAQLQLQGYGAAVAQSLGTGTEAGQPCRRYRNAVTETCVWSGGDRWGFGGAGVGVVSWSDYALALRTEPADRGDGPYLTTQRTTVGQPFDRHVFDKPSDLADE